MPKTAVETDASQRIRVLVVDDSVVARRLLTEMLSADPALLVVGTAANGRIALRQVESLKPDVITLDLEMPEMDGLTTLTELRKSNRTLPVLVVSTSSKRGAAATMECLAAGATDYVAKPENAASPEAALQKLRDDLIPKIKGLFPVRGRVLQATAGLMGAVRALRRIDVVAIGVSTGGPNALCAMIPQLPRELPVPVVIVQHMPPMFTAQLAERLAGISPMKVQEARAGDVLVPGCIWIAPGDYHLTVARQGTSTLLRTNQDPPENSCRPAADVLFRSVAGVFGANTLAVVMTGMGTDGLRGCEAIQKAGGQIIVQDQATSVVGSMPGAIVQAGLADKVLPLPDLALEIVTRAREGRLAFGGTADARARTMR